MRKPVKNYTPVNNSTRNVTSNARNALTNPEVQLSALTKLVNNYLSTTPYSESVEETMLVVNRLRGDISLQSPKINHLQKSTTMENSIFNYNGNNVTFQKGDKVMVNANDMSRCFGKRPIDWLKNTQTSDFLTALSKVRNITLTDLVQVTKGGSNPGTWMHEDVAMEFARWLSPEFAIWTNDRIKELLNHGVTAMNPEQLLNDPDFAISILTKLKEERAEKEKYRVTSELQQKELIQVAPKVQYHDAVLQSDSLISTTVIAKEFGMSAQKLNRILHDRGVIYMIGGTWVLYRKYDDLGYAKPKTYTYITNEGESKTRISLYWTEKGRKFIHEFMNNLVSSK